MLRLRCLLGDDGEGDVSIEFRHRHPRQLRDETVRNPEEEIDVLVTDRLHEVEGCVSPVGDDDCAA